MRIPVWLGRFSGAALRPEFLLACLGLALRAGYVWHTGGEAPHPDLGSFLPANLPLDQPFDTSPREPLFVWWLWLLGRLGIVSTAAIRLATACWYVPALLLFLRLAGRLLGRGPALAAGLAYALLPGQVLSDVTGLRHLLETVAVLALLDALLCDPALAAPRRLGAAAAAVAAAVLTRVNYAGSGLLLLGAGAARSRRARPLLALLPALLLLSFHLRNNQVRHGDALYSVNLHTYFFSNLEYIGKPGFPASFEEWQKAPHTPRLAFRAWAGRHSPYELARDSFVGLGRGLWTFYEKVYFSLGLPAAVKWPLLLLYAAGFCSAWFVPGLRLVPLALLLFTLPYAFVGHVFWAGRFFMPFAPLGLLLAAHGALLAGAKLRGLRAR